MLMIHAAYNQASDILTPRFGMDPAKKNRGHKGKGPLTPALSPSEGERENRRQS